MVNNVGRCAVQQIRSSNVRFGSKADIPGVEPIRFYPQSDRLLRRREMTLSAISDQSATQQKGAYSITSFAVASSGCGILRPSAVAVLRLIESRYFVGSWNGRSSALSPRKMRST